MKPMIWMVILGVALLAGQAFADGPLVLNTPTDRENYTNGVTIARDLKQQAGVVNLDILIKGMMDELTGEKLLLTEEDLQKTMAALKAGIEQRKMQAAMKRGGVKAPVDAMTKKADVGPNAAPDEQAARIAPVKKAGASLVERAKMRSAVKKRAAEMRRRTIEQERAADGRRKAI